MKKIFITFLILLFTMSASFSQNIIGQWNGTLNTGYIKLRIVFHIEKSDNGYSATLDSPDQGANGLPVSSVAVGDDSIRLVINSIRGEYTGKIVSDDSISGIFTQMGHQIPLNLIKGTTTATKISRPQEPKPPFPYYSEEVKFVNKIDGDTLAGTLTLPSKDGKYPVAVMITGSGAQNRNEEVFGHKPFLVIADYLTRNGIGVLRYDDRGTAKSTGNFKTATTYDFSKDVEAAINYLLTRDDVNKKEIGLIGHSEGGIIAPMVAQKDKNIAFIVLLAGTGVAGDKLLLSQAKAIGKASGMSEEALGKAAEIDKSAYELVKKTNDQDKLKEELKNHLGTEIKDENQLTMAIDQLTSPWFEYFLKYNPAPALEKIKIPVLALNGSKDLQVPAQENLPAIKSALERGGNKKYKIVEMEGLNHLFQECNTGSPTEYSKIEQTFSPKALKIIKDWIEARIK